MGCYSSVVHPETKKELQFYGGNDSCHTFNVGDSVPFRIIEDYAGEADFQDGVYEGNAYPDKPNAWIVIKDHKIVAVIDQEAEDARFDQSNKLYNEYGIEELPESCWSEAAWQERRKREEEAKQRFDAYRESISHLSPDEQFAHIVAYPLHNRLNYQEIAKKLIHVEELPDTSSIYYTRFKDSLNKTS
jgi:hypothetical protein